MQRILICGDRNWTNYDVILKSLSDEHQRESVEVVIQGEATGADVMGKQAAIQLGIPVLSFPADWRKHGRSAGPIRNRQQLKEGKPTKGLVYHDFLENSKGTKDMTKVLQKNNVPYEVFTTRDRKDKA